MFNKMLGIKKSVNAIAINLFFLNLILDDLIVVILLNNCIIEINKIESINVHK